MNDKKRELLGRLVREEWVAWAKSQPSPKPSWLLPWEDLSEADREVDRRIGERLFDLGLDCARAMCEQRAENERIYDSMRGEARAVPYVRAVEDIEAFRQSGELLPIGGAYAGAGRSIRNPLEK